MQRDMELVRKILFTIEDKYVNTTLHGGDIQIDGYDMQTIAYHCSIMENAGLISSYKGQYGGNKLLFFFVGGLTWDGHELLDKIKSDTVWNKTKTTIKTNGIPFVLDAVKQIAAAITAAMIKSAIEGIT